MTVDGKNYTLINKNDGTFELETSEFQYLNTGDIETLVFKYTAKDPSGAESLVSTATVKIHGTTDIKLIASNETFVDDEDAIDGSGATAGGYSDLDDGNVAGKLEFTIDNVNYNGSNPVVYSALPATVVGSNGQTYNIIDLGNGKFELNKAQFQSLKPGEFVKLTVPYTVTAGVLTSTANAEVIVIGRNDPPVANDDDAGTIQRTQEVNVPITNNDSDPDNDPLTVTIQKLVIDGNEIPSGDWSDYFTYNTTTKQLEFTSDNMNIIPGTTADVKITYQVDDGNGGTDDAIVFVKVVGDAVFVDGGDEQFVEDEDGVDSTGATAGGFTDQDDSDAPAALQFTINNVSYNGQGTLSYTLPTTVVGSDGVTYTITNLGGGKFSLDKAAFQTLAQGEFVTLTFNYTVTDGSVSDTASTKVVIIGVNDGPDAVNDDAGIIEEGTTVTVPVLTNDSDPDGDPIHVTRITKITIDGTTITDPTLIAQYVTLLPNNQVFIDTSSIPNKTTDYNIVVSYEISDPYGLKDIADIFVAIKNTNETTYYGDKFNDSYIVTSGDANASNGVVITASSLNGYVADYNDNTVSLDDATASGDLGSLTLKAIAGNATAYASPFTKGGIEYGLALADATLSNNTFNFGDDTVSANRGEVVGDAISVIIAGDQGNATANYDIDCFNPFAKATANVDVQNNEFNFGDDVLTVGKGDVYGDVKTLDISYSNGTASGNGITQDDDNWFHGNVFNFGDDTISAREGTVTGDLGSVKVDGTTYDLSKPADLAAFQATTAYTNNTFNFGKDTFVFNIAQPLEVKITDFGIGGVADILKLSGVANVNGGGVDLTDLLAISKIVNDGAGHIQLVVDANNDGTNEGSVTFLNINFDGTKLEITDYLNSTDIIVTA